MFTDKYVVNNCNFPTHFCYQFHKYYGTANGTVLNMEPAGMTHETNGYSIIDNFHHSAPFFPNGLGIVFCCWEIIVIVSLTIVKLNSSQLGSEF